MCANEFALFKACVAKAVSGGTAEEEDDELTIASRSRSERGWLRCGTVMMRESA